MRNTVRARRQTQKEEEEQKEEEKETEEEEKKKQTEKEALDNYLLDNAPDGFICPITHNLFTDPVLTSDGLAYDRPSLLQWVATCQSNGRPFTSPVTGAAMDPTATLDNFHLKSLVGDYVEKQTEIFMQMRVRAQEEEGGGDQEKGEK